MSKKWNGIFRIIEATLIGVDGNVIWRDEDRKNIIHKAGSYFILNRTFNSLATPSNYYFGLDNRTTLGYIDTAFSVVQEPSGNGYSRVAVSSVNQFTPAPDIQENAELISPTLTYSCSVNSWGPVSNLFVTSGQNYGNGVLISSVKLSQPISVSAGQSFIVKMGLSLYNCT